MISRRSSFTSLRPLIRGNDRSRQMPTRHLEQSDQLGKEVTNYPWLIVPVSASPFCQDSRFGYAVRELPSTIWPDVLEAPSHKFDSRADVRMIADFCFTVYVIARKYLGTTQSWKFYYEIFVKKVSSYWSRKIERLNPKSLVRSLKGCANVNGFFD